MKTAGIIPARWGSTRFPGKMLTDICGKPLIIHVIENARKAESLDVLTVATDDQRIFDVVEAAGCKAVMTSADHPSGTDRIAEALREVDAEIVVNIQGDEPFIDPYLIDRVVETLACGGWDMCTAAAPILDMDSLHDPSVVKVVLTAQSRALYFSRAVIPFVRDKIPDSLTYLRHIGVYGYMRGFLESFVKQPPSCLERAEKLEQLRALQMGAKIFVLETGEEGMGIDTPADVKYAERAVRAENRDVNYVKKSKDRVG